MDPLPRRRTLTALLGLPVGLAAAASSARAAEHKHDTAKAGATDHHAMMMKRVDAIESKQAISEILYLYARGWDRLDEEAVLGCFWPESSHAHGSFKGKSHDFITVAFPRIRKIIGTTHMVSNPIILLDGDRALSECYFQAHHRRLNTAATDEEDYYIQGRYIDRFERRGGLWKIIHRQGLSDVERVVPRADVALRNAPPEQRGRRKPDDALYGMMADFAAKQP